MAAECWPFVQQQHPMVRQRHLPRQRDLPSINQPGIVDGVVGARHGRVVTNVVRSPVRPATRWIRVVSMAPARIIAGKIATSRRSRSGFPALGERT
jgi:hypothetical protein